MKYSSDLIEGLGQAAATAELDGSEREIYVPHTLVPVASIPGPMSDFNGFDTVANQRASFMSHFERGRAASAAEITDNVARLGRGFWRVFVRMATVASFTQTLDGTVSNHLLWMLGPNGATAFLIAHWSVNLAPQITVQEYFWMFRQDGWQLQLRTPATGVAQTHVSSVSISAGRLL